MTADQPAMNATEWIVRKELLRVTNDIPEDDYANQAAGWRRIADAASSRAEQKLRCAIRELERAGYPRSDMVEEMEEARAAAEKDAR